MPICSTADLPIAAMTALLFVGHSATTSQKVGRFIPSTCLIHLPFPPSRRVKPPPGIRGEARRGVLVPLLDEAPSTVPDAQRFVRREHMLPALTGVLPTLSATRSKSSPNLALPPRPPGVRPGRQDFGFRVARRRAAEVAFPWPSVTLVETTHMGIGAACGGIGASE